MTATTLDPPQTSIAPTAASGAWILQPRGNGRPSCRFDAARRLLLRGDVEVDAPPRALAILETLVAHRDRVVTKQELLDTLWPDSHVSEASLTEAMGVLRTALGDDSQNPAFVATVHRVGYRLVAEVVDLAAARDDVQTPRMPSSVVGVGPPIELRAKAARRPLWVALALTALTVILTGVWAAVAPRPVAPVTVEADAATLRFIVELPDELRPRGIIASMVAVDPRGAVVYAILMTPDVGPQIYRRRLDSLELVPVAGTEGAQLIFGGQGDNAVGFLRGQELWAVPVGDGAPWPLAAVGVVTSFSWGDDGWIYCTRYPGGGIWRLPAKTGGRLEMVLTPDLERGVTALTSPHRVAGRLFYTEWRGHLERSRIVWRDPASGDGGVLLERALLVAAWRDRVLALSGEELVTVPFDPVSLTLHGPSTVIASQARGPAVRQLFQVAASANGQTVVVGRPENPFETRLSVVDEAGNATVRARLPGALTMSATSGDSELLVLMRDAVGTDLWIFDRDGGSRRLTNGLTAGHPVVNAQSAFFVAAVDGEAALHRLDLAHGESHHVVAIAADALLCAITPDGREVVYASALEDERLHLYQLELATGKQRALTTGGADELRCSLSSDGSRLAFEVVEAGRTRVDIAEYPTMARRQELEIGNAHLPVWGSSPDRLFFVRAQDQVFAATVSPAGRVEAASAVFAADANSVMLRLAPWRHGVAVLEDSLLGLAQLEVITLR